MYRYIFFLAETPQLPPSLPHLGSYTRALLVSQDRRHLFVTPWQYWIPHDPTLFSMDSTFNGCHGLGHLLLITPCSADTLTHLMEGHMIQAAWELQYLVQVSVLILPLCRPKERNLKNVYVELAVQFILVFTSTIQSWGLTD